VKKLFFLGLSLLLALGARSQCLVNINKPDTASQICGTTDSLDVGTASVTPINNTFNNGSVGFGWSVTSAAQFNNPCGAAPTTYLWMGPTSTAPRTLATIPINVSCGGQVCFELKFAQQSNPSPCEGPDLANEGVDLQYRIFSGAWTNIFYFQPNQNGNNNAACFNCGDYTAWATYCFTIPIAAQTATTEFRWIQTNSSQNLFDHWGLDSAVITNNCAEVSHLWNTGDTTTSIEILSLEDSTYWCRRIVNQLDTCFDTVRVISERPDPHLSIVPNIPICEGTEVELRVDSVSWIDSTVTYNKLWTPSSMVVSPNFDTTLSHPITQDTAFTLTVTHPQYSQCSGYDTLSVEIDNNLAFDSITILDEYCNNSDGLIQVMMTGGTGQYWYDINNTYNTSDSRQNLLAITYPIHVLDTLTGCELDTSVNVPFNIGIQLDDLWFGSPDCPGGDTSAKVWSVNNYSAITYHWYKNGTQFRNNTTVLNTDSINGLTKGNYTVIISDQKCEDTVEFVIIEPDTLMLSLTGSDTLCNVRELELIPILSGGTPPYTTDWFSTISPTYFVRGNQDTTVFVYFEDSRGCISETFSYDLYLPPSIETNLRDTAICKGSIVFLDPDTKFGTGKYAFTWNTGWTSETLPTNTLSNKTYFLTVEDGCLYPHLDTAAIRIFQQPDPKLRWDPVCLPQEMTVSTDVGYKNYYWFLNGDSIFSSNDHKISLNLDGVTPIHWRFQTEDDCYVYGEDTLVAYAQPSADFDWDYNLYDPLYNNEVVFYNYSTDYSELVWSFPGDKQYGEVATHIYPEAGFYSIKLEATNGFCKDDTVRNIEIIPVGNIYVPNAFTPNNDGVNDVFKPSIINIEEDSYQFSVFNRWGNLIFETTDTNQGWSGNFKGTASQEGIYVYVIRAKTKDGRLLDLTGEITLTRY
jgi:gliding motility-associated-like protein